LLCYLTFVAKRNVVPLGGKGHLAVDGDAKQAISRIASQLGMKEIAVVSRAYIWLATQDDVVVKGVLGLLPKGYEPDVASLVLQRIAGNKKTPK
jgi:hypothetical protein